jgi:hypothetical protein
VYEVVLIRFPSMIPGFSLTGDVNILTIIPNSVAITSTNYLTVQHIVVCISNVEDLAGWQIYIVYNTDAEFQSANIPLTNIFLNQHSSLFWVNGATATSKIFECDRAGYNPPGPSGSGFLLDMLFVLNGPVGSTARWWIGLEHPQYTTELIHSDLSLITPINYDTNQVVILPEYQPALLFVVFALSAASIAVLKRKKAGLG